LRLCYVGDPASVHTQRWVRWFAEDHDVSVIATAIDESLADLTATTLPQSAALPGLRLARSVRAVRRTLGDLRPDIVHAHFINEAGWFAAASGWRPFVLSAWGSDIYRAPHESRLAGRLNPWAARRADAVTCDSQDQAHALESWAVDASRIEVINWGVDRREFHPGVDGTAFRAELQIPVSAPVILSPRQWLANSNIEAIVEAHALMAEEAYLVLKRLPRFERDAAASVAETVAASPRADRIRVVAEITGEQLPGMYAAADVVVSLCTTDGTPVSLLEAMAIGRPVLALRNGSVAEWVSEPGGRLVDTLDRAVLAGALDGFVRDRGSHGAASHNVEIVAARADRATEMARVADLYARLQAGQSRRGG
jgi:glycosyltransferase involved in cell wall biosynthesis